MGFAKILSFDHLVQTARAIRDRLLLFIDIIAALETDLAISRSESDRVSFEYSLKQKLTMKSQTKAEFVAALGKMVESMAPTSDGVREALLQLQENLQTFANRRAPQLSQDDRAKLIAARDELAQLDAEHRALQPVLATAPQLLAAPPLSPSSDVLLGYGDRLAALIKRGDRYETVYPALASVPVSAPPPAPLGELAVATPIRQIVIPYLRNQAFTGRNQELKRLHKVVNLEQSRLGESVTQPSPSLIFITGLPGVGKTQLALEYAYSHLSSFQLILWVNAEGENLTPAMARVAREVLPASTLEPDEVIAQRLTKHLEHGGPHLLILDNVTSPKSYGELLPRLGQTQVLVTSRRRDLSPFPLDRAHDQRIAVLPPRFALKLLLRGRSLSDEDLVAAEELCKELGYLPLALAIAAQSLRVTEESPAVLLSTIRQSGPTQWADEIVKDLDLEEEGRRFIRSYPSLSRLFDATYELVRRYCPHAELVAQCAGSFASASIDRQLLLEAADVLAEASGQPRQTSERGRQALGWLLRLGFADPAGTKGISFHWLVQDYLRYQGGASARTAVLSALSQRVRAMYGLGLTPANLLQLVPHRSHMERADRMIHSSDDQQSYWITIGVLWLKTLYGEYGAVLQRCAEVLPQVADPYLQAWLWHQQGWVLMPLGRYREALTSLRRAFGIRRRLQQTTALELCYEFQDIARAQIALGRYVSAHRCLLYVQRYLQTVADPKFRQVGEALATHQLGRVAFYRGCYAEAEKLFYRSLSIKRIWNIKNDVLYANTLNGLGELHCMTGAYEQALEKFEHARHIRQQISSPHPDMLSTQDGIAQVYLRQGRLEAAAHAFKDAAEQRERLFGSSHPDLATSLEGYGRALTAQKRLDDGWQVLRRAYLIRHRALGPRHPLLAASYESLGECALLRGQLRRTRALFQRAQQIRTTTRGGCGHGGSALDVLSPAWNSAYQALRTTADEPHLTAERVRTDFVLTRCVEALFLFNLHAGITADSPAPLKILATHLLQFLGDADRALFARVLARCSGRLGGEHPFVLWLGRQRGSRDN